MKQGQPSEQYVDIEQASLINIWTNKWVLEWCKKYHPEAFIEAKNFIEDYLKDSRMEHR